MLCIAQKLTVIDCQICATVTVNHLFGGGGGGGGGGCKSPLVRVHSIA